MNTLLNFIEYFDDMIYEGKKQDLAGILLIVDNKILLVKPLKFKDKKNKWSIPKGKVEKGISEIETSILELREETGILLNKNIKIDKVGKLKYKKSGKIKNLTYFKIKENKNNLNVEFKGDVIKRKYYNNNEIYKAKLFSFKEAKEKIEFGQLKLINEL
jgi:predicted NUDIX family NTP pyrophosphohydrolase